MSKFTNDEMLVAKNISKEYKWIARDKSGLLCASALKPHKDFLLGIWDSASRMCDMDAFGWMFKSIIWEDKEPTLIKDIYSPSILDDVEKRYLTAVLKPLSKVKNIYKAKDPAVIKEFLVVIFYDGETMKFTYFKPGTMYKGMEIAKMYTPEELELEL